jgi:2-keto-4-pentenoate hydratase
MENMMSNFERDAAETLWKNWQAGTCIETLPKQCRPRDIDEGYRWQRALVEVSKQKPVGYKIAASSQAGQAHLKITHPVYGRLLQSKFMNSGDNAKWIDHSMSVAELEFAFRFDRDVPARTEPYEMNEVMDHVGAMHIGIELPGSRFTDPAAAGIAQIIADNASAGFYVLGPKASGDWREIDLAAHKVRMLVDGELKTEGQGADALGDPRLALTWIVNQLSQTGITMERGQLVTTGVCGMPVPVAKGQKVIGDFGVFGKVSVGLV